MKGLLAPCTKQEILNPLSTQNVNVVSKEQKSLAKCGQVGERYGTGLGSIEHLQHWG